MEVNDCLYEGWNEYTKDTHCEEWPDDSSAETHIVRAGTINDKQDQFGCCSASGLVCTGQAGLQGCCGGLYDGHDGQNISGR